MLDIIALGILLFIAASLTFGAVAIVGIPHQIALERDHPQQDAIYFAGWVSLFTLHVAWPLVWIWAAAYRDAAYRDNALPRFAQLDEDTAINDRAEADRDENDLPPADEDITDSVTLLHHRYEVLDDRIDRIENAIMAASDAA